MCREAGDLETYGPEIAEVATEHQFGGNAEHHQSAVVGVGEEREGRVVGTYAEAHEPVFIGAARLVLGAAAVGRLGEVVREACRERPHTRELAAAIEVLGEDKHLTFEEDIPSHAKTEGHVEAQERVDGVVGAEASGGAVGHVDRKAATIGDAQTQHGVEVQAPVLDAREGGVEVPQEFGRCKCEAGAVHLVLVAGGYSEVEVDACCQGAEDPLADTYATGKAAGGGRPFGAVVPPADAAAHGHKHVDAEV